MLLLPTRTSPSGFVYPAMHSFPPFYTLQREERVREAQLRQWAALVLSWSRHHADYNLPSRTSPLFSNAEIHRTLDPPTLEAIVAHLVATEQAIKDKDEVVLCCTSPAELAVQLEGHSTSGAILTFYELTQDFPTQPPALLRVALQLLAQQGKVVLFDKGQGVKFV